MQLPEYIKKLLEKLNKSGYEAYAVGGCVRDGLRGISPKDYDIATSAQPRQIEEVFSGYKIIETGIKHGTVTVVTDSGSVEITTFRIDGNYFDNRHPDGVTFTDKLVEDLSRRDFTVNAMAYSDGVGIVDIFGGESDLSDKLIRAVGDPCKRFDEDALRIMRALRFAAVLGFEIEQKTAAAIHKKCGLLKNVSAERIAVELNKLLCGKCGDILVEFSDVFSVIIPEIADCRDFCQYSKYHDKDVLRHIAAAVDSIEPVAHLRMTMLLHDLGKPACAVFENGVGHFKGHSLKSTEIAERTLENLRCDKETQKKVLFLVARHDRTIESDERQVKRWLNKCGGFDLFSDLIKVHIADDMAKNPLYHDRIEKYNLALETARRIVSENQCFSLKDLAVDGNDIKSLGYSGKSIGEALDFLLEAVVDEKCENNVKNLQNYLEQHFKK